MVWCAYGTGLWIGGRATGSARRTGNEGLCATYVARLAMTGKEASVAGGAGLNCAGGCLAFLFF